MKRFVFYFIAVFIVICSASCGRADYCELTFFSMDTFVTLKADAGNDELLEDCRELVLSLEKRFSKTDSGSEIYAVNNRGGGTAVSDYTAELTEYALEIADAVDGRFSPALGRLTSVWDFKNAKVPDDAVIKDALKNCDYRSVSVDDGMITLASGVLLDLGGIAKGYICEAALEFLRDGGAEYGIVNIGGNIGVFGDNPSNDGWTVGIKNPSQPSSLIGAIEVNGGYVSVSGDYERYFEAGGVRYHHIIDPSTGYPSDSGVRSAAVWSDDGALCDALSTALFVGGADYALELYDSGVFEFEAVIVTDDGVVMTDGIADKFTLY